MIEPYEETWTANEDTGGWHIGPQPEGRCTMFRNSPSLPGNQQPKTAALISAAPEMARMLLSLEWARNDRDGEVECPVCFSYAGVHDDGCAMLSLLKKAGVR